MSELSRFAETIYFYYGPTRGRLWTYMAILLRYLPLCTIYRDFGVKLDYFVLFRAVTLIGILAITYYFRLVKFIEL